MMKWSLSADQDQIPTKKNHNYEMSLGGGKGLKYYFVKGYTYPSVIDAHRGGGEGGAPYVPPIKIF
jgi:hypothetical protein